MCGRFGLYADKTQLEKIFHIESFIEYGISYNIAPTQTVPVILNHGDARISALLQWGFIPSWAKKDAKSQINARVETVATKPFYRSAFKNKRCLVPASCWYEWQTEDGKQPFCFEYPDHSPIAIAGIWEHWHDENSSIYTFALITRDANKQCSEVHSRMPLIVERDHFDLWLDPKKTTEAELQTVMNPKHESKYHIYAISKKINTPKNNDPSCISPI